MKGLCRYLDERGRKRDINAHQRSAEASTMYAQVSILSVPKHRDAVLVIKLPKSRLRSFSSGLPQMMPSNHITSIATASGSPASHILYKHIARKSQSY